MSQQLFKLSAEENAKLGIDRRKRSGRAKIYKIIFEAAKEKGKTVLNIEEITAGYYVLWSKKYGEKIRDKKWITASCGMLSGLPNQPRVLTRVGRGEYKLYEEGDDEKYKVVCYRKTAAYYSGRRGKAIEYKGKIYKSMHELANTLGLHYSAVSKCYKRHNGDLSSLGTYNK